MIALSKEARARLEHQYGNKFDDSLNARCIRETLAALDSAVAEVAATNTLLSNAANDIERRKEAYDIVHKNLSAAIASAEASEKLSKERLLLFADMQGQRNDALDKAEASRKEVLHWQTKAESNFLELRKSDASLLASRKEVERMRAVVEQARNVSSRICGSTMVLHEKLKELDALAASPQPATAPATFMASALPMATAPTLQTTEALAEAEQVPQLGMATPPAYVSVELRDGIPTLTAWTREAWDGKTPFPRTAYTRSDIVDRAAATDVAMALLAKANNARGDGGTMTDDQALIIRARLAAGCSLDGNDGGHGNKTEPQEPEVRRILRECANRLEALSRTTGSK